MTGEGRYIGGIHAVTAALESDRRPRRVLLASGRDDDRIVAVGRLAEGQGVAVVREDMKSLDMRLPKVRHQGCIAEYEAIELPEWHESDLEGLIAASDPPWILALDQVQDPHNLGACLRSAAAAGVTAVIVPRKRSAGLTAAVHKVAAGGVERVPLVPVTNLVRALARLQDAGFWAIGLAGEAERSLYAIDLPERLVLVAGGEEQGLRALTRRQCDDLACLPMAAGIESLNVSVATGIALFEARRRRSPG